ncbi:hypothetical protein Tco_0606994 [Tanacetum coccineum]
MLVNVVNAVASLRGPSEGQVQPGASKSHGGAGQSVQGIVLLYLLVQPKVMLVQVIMGTWNNGGSQTLSTSGSPEWIQSMIMNERLGDEVSSSPNLSNVASPKRTKSSASQVPSSANLSKPPLPKRNRSVDKKSKNLNNSFYCVNFGV